MSNGRLRIWYLAFRVIYRHPLQNDAEIVDSLGFQGLIKTEGLPTVLKTGLFLEVET